MDFAILRVSLKAFSKEVVESTLMAKFVRIRAGNPDTHFLTNFDSIDFSSLSMYAATFLVVYKNFDVFWK